MKKLWSAQVQTLVLLHSHRIKLFICVEGRTDIIFWKNISSALSQHDSRYIDLEKCEKDGTIIFVPMGGSTLDLWTYRLKGFSLPEIHIFDRDADENCTPKASQQNAFNIVSGRDNCCAFITYGRELENLLHIEAIKKIDTYASLDCIFSPSCDVPARVAQHVHTSSGSPKIWGEVSPEDKKKKESAVKRRLSLYATKHMTPELLQEVDVHGFVDSIFKKIREHVA